MVLDSLQISGQHILHLFSLFSIACVGRGASTVNTPSCSIHNNNGSETQEIHGSLVHLGEWGLDELRVGAGGEEELSVVLPVDGLAAPHLLVLGVHQQLVVHSLHLQPITAQPEHWLTNQSALLTIISSGAYSLTSNLSLSSCEPEASSSYSRGDWG